MNDLTENRIENAFHVLSRESRELYIPTKIAELYESISTLDFYKNYVSKNIPVVVRGGIKHWKAVDNWSTPYFRDKIGNKMVNVAVTPNGYADAVANEMKLSGASDKEYFVIPEERCMTMNEFLERLERPRSDSIFYIQKQNSNFEKEFSELWRDIDSRGLSWATKAFSAKPDAVNFWMGDARAVTSMHKDPYENIYCVISGEKEFILHPPTDLPWIPYKMYPLAAYKEIERGKWITESTCKIKNLNAIELEKCIDCNDKVTPDVVPWIAINPLNPNFEKYPRYKNALKLDIKVSKGDVFYLPSLWFHHVKQSHACIAINYWYDMEYDIKYAYYKSLETLCK